MTSSSRSKRSEDYYSLRRSSSDSNTAKDDGISWIVKSTKISNAIIVLLGIIIPSGSIFVFNAVFKSASTEVTSLQKQVVTLERVLEEERSANSKSNKEAKLLIKDIQLLVRARDTRICTSGVRRSISESSAAIVRQVCSTPDTNAPLLAGQINSSKKFGVGWIDLNSLVNFKKGDIIRISIGGTAQIVRVRLLPAGSHPNSPAGLISEKFHVPDDRIIEINVLKDQYNVSQISVHGGQNPWGESLGADNGTATLKSVELVRP